ncbi:MAG: NeuD/PglB/VioB family sugar acetyltransferase [Ferruginibacter sp.]
MTLIGYSGHAFVVYGILKAVNVSVDSYCDAVEKSYNPFNLAYLGTETTNEAIESLKNGCFISIGNNGGRNQVYNYLSSKNILPVNAIHPAAIIDSTVKIANHAVMISAGVCINPLASINIGVICNTGCIIEHECIIGAFAHIGPGAVLCGNVTIGEGSFVGAASVIKQGITIGKNVIIGAGAVVVKNVGDNETVIGNPSRSFEKNIQIK